VFWLTQTAIVDIGFLRHTKEIPLFCSIATYFTGYSGIMTAKVLGDEGNYFVLFAK
jgi:hypothetical protein